MNSKLHYTIFNTTAGWVGLLGSDTGLRQLTLPRRSPEEVLRLFGDSINRASKSPSFFHDLTERLMAYFSGHRVEFPDNLDLSGTAFQRAVWTTSRSITYGETRSYKWVAEQIGNPNAVRAAGQALGRNPLPIIVPCHRVLASNGNLTGFAGGLDMKRYLLHLEATADA